MSEKKNIHAQALGRLGKGKPKRLSEEERERRRKDFEVAKLSRWIKNK